MCQKWRIGRRPRAPAIACRGAIGAVQRVPESRRRHAREERGGSRFDPIEQRRSDAASPLRGMDDAP